MREKENFIAIGYYICSVMDTPDYLHSISDKLISVSECMCEHQPVIYFCAGWKPQGDNEDYRIKCRMTPEEYLKMSAEINALFEKKLYHIDGRFVRELDAIYFYQKYFSSSEYMLICLEVEEGYKEILEEDGFEISEIHSDTESVSPKKFLGYDIIGWDVSNFHSFLCNKLQLVFPYIKFTDLGLLDMEYQEVKEISRLIQGKGEPVEWIPCRLEGVI